MENRYVYPVDPINQYDLDGRQRLSGIARTATTIASILSVVPVLAPLYAPIAFAGPLGLAAHSHWGALAQDALGIVPGINEFAAAAKAERPMAATEGAYEAALLAGKSKIGAQVQAQLARQTARKAVGWLWAAKRLSQEALTASSILTGVSIAYTTAPDHGLYKYY